VNTRLTRAARFAAVATALALVAAACSSDKKSSTTAAVTTATATAASSGATTTAGATETTAGGGSATTAGSTATTAGGPTSTAASGGDPLGTPNKATGAPIKIGYIGDGQSASIDNTDELLAAEATVKWANDYQGGLAGHPIDLVTCTTKQDAALATDCANQMVSAGVPAVLMNVSGQGDAIAKPLQDANIPFIAWQFSGSTAADTE
jgi:ABC-type branched-subunit amino acid transport system substrate-binding protein